VREREPFGYCLRCGQPLRSDYSRQCGFGLQCWEALSPRDRRRLVALACAIQADLDELARARLHPRLDTLLARIRWIRRRAKS
jgi:Family of unknown function (DUF6011)